MPIEKTSANETAETDLAERGAGCGAEEREAPVLGGVTTPTQHEVGPARAGRNVWCALGQKGERATGNKWDKHGAHMRKKERKQRRHDAEKNLNALRRSEDAAVAARCSTSGNACVCVCVPMRGLCVCTHLSTPLPLTSRRFSSHL